MMQLDILSDLHINAHLKHLDPSDAILTRLWERLEPKGEVLLVAGDIGEITLQNVNVLKRLKKLFYKEVVCVLGNHDLHGLNHRVIYLYDENRELVEQKGWGDFRQKRDEAKVLYADAGIHLLDGDVIDLDGLKIGGDMGWYDGLYPKRHRISLGKHKMFGYREYEDMQELWNSCMPDDDIKPMRRFDGLLQEELSKIDGIVEHCDIMLSHINPSIDPAHQDTRYKDDPSCGFYSFDGKGYTDRFNGTHWIFGHSHFCSRNSVARENKEPFELISNTLGYPSENPRAFPKIMTLEV
jgi:hypothetical protein